MKHIDEWISTLGKLLEQTAWERLEKITYKVEDYSSRLKEIRHSTEMERTLVLISDIWDMTLEFEIYYMDIQERCRTLDMYGIKSEKNIVSLSADLPKTWHDLYVKSKEIYFRISGLKEKNCSLVMRKVDRLAKKLRELWDRFKTEGPSSEAKSLEEGLDSLAIFRAQLETIDKQIIEVNEYQRVLKRPLTDFEVFTILKTEFENLEEIYKVFQELQETTNRIEELTCDVYFAAPEKFSLKQVADNIDSLKQRFGNHVVLQKLESRMISFDSYQRIIYLLNNDKLRTRHWQMLENLTDIHTEEEFLNFKLNTFLGIDQDKLEKIIVDTIDIAQEEARIEDELTVIKLRWEERNFTLTREPITLSKKTGSHKLTIINQFNSLNEEVEHDDSVIETMIQSSKSAYFKPDLEKMKTVLAEITAILKTWIATQENCLILARVLLTFVSADFREIDEIRTSFEEDFKMYNKLMEEVAKKPIVSKSCLQPERRNMLKNYKAKFLSHKKACHKLIELKQKSLPRLSFLSDQESLILLGGFTGDGDVFQKVVRKILGQSFKSLVFESTSAKNVEDTNGSDAMTVSKVESLNGEILQIYRTVDCRQPTDIWLSQLIEEMCRGIKNYMRRGLKEEISLMDFAFEHYESTLELVSIARFNVLWTIAVEKIFDSEHPMNQIKSAYQSLTSKVASLCKEVIHVTHDNEIKLKKASNLLNLYLSKRNQLFNFLQKNVTSCGDFAWKSSFRLIWKRDHDDIEARQGYAIQKFGYEYQAAFRVPLETGSSLKAQFAMFTSLHEYRPIYLKGAIFSGKSSCINELAFLLGRYVVFLDLNPSFSPQDMVESLQGLCRANCWAHYDGFDLLHYETLSILTTQLQQINLAQSMNLKEFHLSGRKTQLGLQTGFFFVSRKARDDTNLPPISLCSQFRQVYLQTPDIAPLVQAELLARGFGSPKTLTNSLIAIVRTFYKITTPGFRRIPMLTITREIFSRLPNTDKTENSHVATAAMETMKAILPASDMDIIGPFIREHFQDSELSVDTGDASGMNQFVKDLALRIQKGWWPLVIGPRGSGKSYAIEQAAKDLKHAELTSGVGSAYSIVEVKLARHTVQDLFGSEDESGKWNLGIITRYLTPTSKPCVIVLVTPISSSISHNFASMYDQGYFQTESNHSFTIPPQIRFVFETSNVETVSSLLLARCSLMHMPDIPRETLESLDPMNSELMEEASKILISAVEAFPKNDDVHSKRGKVDQLVTLYKLMAERSDNDDLSLLSNLIYAFCWSYGATLQDDEDIAKFDSAIRKVTKEVELFQKVTLLEKASIFQQKFDPKSKTWHDMEHPINAILEIIHLMLINDIPVIVVGHLETRIILRNLESKWSNDNGSVLKMNFGSEMSKDICIQQLLSVLKRKGEAHLTPSDDKRLLWMVRQLETRKALSEGCLMSMLCDFAKNKTIYSKDSGFRRKKVKDISLIGQIDRTKGAEILCSMDELNYFCVLSAKNCTANAILTPANFDSAMPQDLFDTTLSIHLDLVTALNQQQLNSQNPAKLLSLHKLENIIRCLKVSASNEDEARLQWQKMLFHHLFLPLWTQNDREMVLQVLKKHEIDTSSWQKADENVFSQVVNNVLDAYESKRRIIVLVGDAGSGKRSAISKSSQTLSFKLHEKLVDPTALNTKTFFSNNADEKEACVINSLLFTTLEDPQDVDKYVQEIKVRLLPNKHITTFLPISTNTCKDVVLKQLLDLLRSEGAAIIGVPQWTEFDLRFCFDNPQGPEQQVVPDMLLKIHMAIVGFSKTLYSRYTPKPSMLSLAYKVTESRIKSRSNIITNRSAQLQNVIEELNALDAKVDSSRKQLDAIMDDLNSNQQKKNQMTEDMESTKLTLETTTEQKTALKRQIPDFQRQVEVRKHDLQASTTKRHAMYEKALEMLKEKAPKDIEKFCSRSVVVPEVEVICSAVLVITEGMKYPETGEPMYVWNHFRGAFAQDDWRQQFYSIDPERHGTVTAFFLERRMKELRKLGFKRAVLAKEEPIADSLLEYCEGFLEIINTVEERIELESRLKVYEEMFVNMNSEVGRLQSTEDSLNEQLKTLNESIVAKEGKMKLLENEINDRKGKLNMLTEMSNALKEQKSDWVQQLQDLHAEKETLIERETVCATAAVYLMELPIEKRSLGLEVIQDAVGCDNKYSNFGTMLDPCHPRNLLNRQTLPGWQEGIIKKFCVVYDPQNILIDLFTEAEPILLYIEDMNDLETIKSAIDEAENGDTLVLNFGSNVNIIFDVIVELKRMCSNYVSIFLCLSQWTPLPSRVTFINLHMSGRELRKMSLHLISVKEKSSSDAGASAKTLSSDMKELNLVESQLMTVIMTPKALVQKHRSILDLSTKIDKIRMSRESSAVDSLIRIEDYLKTVKPVMLFPIAIIAACCDMCTVANRPFMSLSQFVNFLILRVEENPENEEETHLIIFQRYCLAFADRDQLLFQTFILFHFNILRSIYDSDDFNDFINVVSGHEKKEFPVGRPGKLKNVERSSADSYHFCLRLVRGLGLASFEENHLREKLPLRYKMFGREHAGVAKMVRERH